MAANTVTTSLVGVDEDEKKDSFPPVPKIDKIPDGTSPDVAETKVNSAVDTIKQRLKLINKTSKEQNDNTKAAIKRFKSAIKGKVDAIKKEQDEKEQQDEIDTFIGHCNTAIDMTNNVLENIDGITSGDTLTCVNSTLNLIGTASTIFGPAGEVVGTVCGILSSVISLFGGEDETKSPSEVMASIIKSALDDFKNDDIQENFEASISEGQMAMSVLNGIASYNGGQLDPSSEGPILASIDYARVGIPLMGELKSQLKNHRDDANDTKSGYLAKYLYYYCIIFQMKRVLLTLQCSLLRTNSLNSVFKGIHRYLSIGMIDTATECLKFLEEMPKPTPDFTWNKLYRDIHDPAILNQGQREVISKSLDICGITMPGKLVRLVNVAVGDLCILDASEYDKNNTARAGSFLTPGIGDEIYEFERTLKRFGPICNLFRLFKPGEALGEQFKGVAADMGTGAFCLFSIRHNNYVMMETKKNGGHLIHLSDGLPKLDSTDASSKEEDKNRHRLDSMVFYITNDENGELNGGCIADDYVWDSPSQYFQVTCNGGYGSGADTSYEMIFRGFKKPDKFSGYHKHQEDGYKWNLKYYNYGDYTTALNDKENCVNIVNGLWPKNTFIQD